MTTGGGTLPRYERWSGDASRSRWTWLAIFRTGLRLANKDSQARFLVWFSLGFVFGCCGLFFAFSRLEIVVGTDEARGYYEVAFRLLGVDLSGISRIDELRELLWRAVFMLTINVQLFWIMTTLSRVGPGLIADDIKNRALPIYFARPVTPLTYLTGKWMVVATYIALITVVPNLLSLILGAIITGGLQTTAQTVRLAFDLATAGLGIMVFAGLVMLTISCLTSDKRYVTVGWYAFCILPVVGQAIVNENLPDEATSGWLGCISPRSNILSLTEKLFEMRSQFESSPLPADAFNNALLSPVRPIYPAVVLAALTLLCAGVCYRRVIRFSRSAASV